MESTPRQQTSRGATEPTVASRQAVRRRIEIILARGIDALGYTIWIQNAGLTHASSVIDSQLYNVTATYDEYADLMTLEERIAGVIAAYILFSISKANSTEEG